jgi:hypothetical protein
MFFLPHKGCSYKAGLLNGLQVLLYMAMVNVAVLRHL